MARLQNYIDEAYVPTGQEDIPIIAATLKVSVNVTPALIDPCAADGETLLQLAAAWGITPEKTYGIEVNYRRHGALARRLPASNTLLADITLAKCSQWAFDIAYVNPPYGDLSTFERWEGYFLNWISHRLRSGGVLYWVVPYSQVVTDGNLTTLLSKYEIHQMWQTSLAQYRQVVVQAVKRPKDAIADAKLKQILGRWTNLDNVPLKPTQPALTLALGEDHPGPAIFRTGYVPPETLVQVNNRAIAGTTRPKTTHWHSVIPPSPAQIPAALTATGRTLRLPGADGERFIRATQVIYRREYDPVETTDDKGRRTGGRAGYDGHGYAIRSDQNPGGRQVVYELGLHGDFALQVDVTLLSPAETTAYAIAFDWTADNAGDVFLVGGDGVCSLYYMAGDEAEVVAGPFDDCPELRTGAPSQLLLIVEGERFQAAVDKHVVAQTELDGRLGGTRIGLTVYGAQEGRSAEARFNNLGIWQPQK